jgi:uncharacterized membrane protein
MMPRALALHRMAVLSLVALIVLSVAWELVLAPLRPGGSWLVLKVIPLLLPLRGVLKQDVYTMQWSSMLILLYLAEGAVRVMTDTQAISIGLGWAEVILSLIYFISVIAYLRPIKKAAKQQAAAAIKKASQVPSHQ